MIWFIKFSNKQNNSTYSVYGAIYIPQKDKNMHGNAKCQTQHRVIFTYFEFYILCIISKLKEYFKIKSTLFILFSKIFSP